MYISTEQLGKRLIGAARRPENSNPKTTLSVITKERKERAENNAPKLDIDEKAMVAALSKEIGQKETSELTGIRQSQISLLSRGIDQRQFKPELKQKIDSLSKVKSDAIADKAIDRLTDALGVLEELTPNVLRARDAASIAKDMAVVVKSLRPQQDVSQKNLIQVNIHAPSQRKEESYDTVEAS